MNKHLQNNICLSRLVLSEESTSDVIVSLRSTAIVGFVDLLAALNR